VPRLEATLPSIKKWVFRVALRLSRSPLTLGEFALVKMAIPAIRQCKIMSCLKPQRRHRRPALRIFRLSALPTRAALPPSFLQEAAQLLLSDAKPLPRLAREWGMSTKSGQVIYGSRSAEISAKHARKVAEEAVRDADRAEAAAWSIRMGRLWRTSAAIANNRAMPQRRPIHCA
jgi:hypothetical protein